MAMDKAIELAKQGFYVFPIKENSKEPAITAWQHKATRDEEQIKRWWFDPVLQIQRTYNIGISTAKFGKEESLVVVDVDNKDSKSGSDTLFELELDGKELPKTLSQKTPTGGYHYIYKSKEPVKQGADVLGSGLDIRSRGGYIVAAGSQIDGKFYELFGDIIKDAPKWVIEECGKAPEILDRTNKKDVEVNQDYALERAYEYLDNLPPASQGARNAEGYKAASKLKDFGLYEDKTLELMEDSWKCDPPLGHQELKDLVKHVYKYAQTGIGSDSPESVFNPVEYDSKNYLEKMNENFCIIFRDGNQMIIHETQDDKGRPKRNFYSETAFKRLWSPYKIQIGKRNRTYAEVWLDWKDRRQYYGVCFSPKKEVKHNYYNLWQGFTVEPLPYAKADPDQRRGFDLWKEHVFKNICNENEEHFNWVVGYFAHLIQRPYEKPLTTLVFKGKKGVGKNAMVDRIGKFLGSSHYLVAHDSRYLTSNFNGHLDSCLMLVLDEAFWSGDKAADGKIKGITTSPEILIERKGKEPYLVDNLVRLVVIGNEDWLVPASHDERRYAVFQIGNSRAKDRRFFTEMRVLLDEKGGGRVLLDYLGNFDLNSVDINEAPNTEALLEQKTQSLHVFYKFWKQCLDEGQIVNCDLIEGWPAEISPRLLREAFFKFIEDLKYRHRVPDERALGKLLKDVCPEADKIRVMREGKRFYTYSLCDLKTARKSWEKWMGQEIKWEFD